MNHELSKEAQGFIDTYTKKADIVGFWTEEYRSVIVKCIERDCKPEIIRHMTITDIVVNGNKFLLSWKKRIQPLSDEEMEKEYGIKKITK